jgi:hypothetical protein
MKSNLVARFEYNIAVFVANFDDRRIVSLRLAEFNRGHAVVRSTHLYSIGVDSYIAMSSIHSDSADPEVRAAAVQIDKGQVVPEDAARENQECPAQYAAATDLRHRLTD